MGQFKQYWLPGSTVMNANLPGQITPPPGTVWLIYSTFVVLIQDNTTTGYRSVQIKAQSPNQKNYMNALLASVGNYLGTAGTGTSNQYGRGSLTGVRNTLSIPAPGGGGSSTGGHDISGATLLSGNLTVELDYNQLVPLNSSQQFGVQGALVGADKYDLLIYYAELSEAEYFRSL